jgi:hypothetical protein
MGKWKFPLWKFLPKLPGELEFSDPVIVQATQAKRTPVFPG